MNIREHARPNLEIETWRVVDREVFFDLSDGTEQDTTLLTRILTGGNTN